MSDEQMPGRFDAVIYNLVGLLVVFALGLGGVAGALALIVFAVRCAWRAGA